MPLFSGSLKMPSVAFVITGSGWILKLNPSSLVARPNSDMPCSRPQRSSRAYLPLYFATPEL
ncbi:MAG: hypothetical protein BWY59_00640 [Verrucomicrobia bacterium ADurb.Bin345]|nr:MAG: hypothetical protein BWY59_00640 [Verrucomicrobia bacterium ADurb.Bin345]